MKKNKKSPIIAAILNFLIFGLGYIYAGKRIGFGIALLLTELIYAFSKTSFDGVDIFFSLVLGFIFAYDGYRTAEEVNQKG